MGEQKIYKCVCGKEFQTANSFNGHKSHCAQHQIQKHGSLEFYNERNKLSGEKHSDTSKNRNIDEAKKTLDLWLSTQPRCKTCNKIMTAKYGSGIYCSIECAHTRNHTEEEKQHLREYQKNLYELNPRFCVVCGNKIDYNNRRRKTCSNECRSKRLSQAVKYRIENGTHNNWLPPREESYAEKFWKQVLDNNQINYEQQYQVNTCKTYYLIDFLIDGVIDLEIDGKQHTSKEHMKHDHLRDSRLSNLGYIVYRIPYIVPNKNNNEKIVEQINNFIEFYQSYKGVLNS